MEASSLDLTLAFHIKSIALLFIPQFLADKEGKGLGVWSEQASESVHHDFSSLWAAGSYKRALCHKDYESQLYKCVVTYNSRHI